MIPRLSTLALALALLAAPAQAETTKLHYGSRSSEVLTVFPQSGSGHRVVVLVHGGGWQEQGAETELVPQAEALRKKLAAIVVDVNYPQRLELGGAAFPGEPEAVQRAIEWAAANAGAYGGNAARLSVVGESAGSNVSTLAAQRLDAAHAGYVRAVVSDSGPMNLWRIVSEEQANPFAPKVASALGCKLGACLESWAAEWSPRFHIDPASCAPELFGTYATDKVPRSQSEEMASAMQTAGCTSKLVVVPKSGHDPSLGTIGAYAFLEAWGG